jgi:hypothetical protein
MMPFDAYPHRGRRPFGRLTGDNCRREYGLKLQRLIGLNKCAYCGLSLVDTYDHWLMLSVDHVVPTHTGQELGITSDWLDDYWNTVLCCAACKTFGDLFPLEGEVTCPNNSEEFLALRDRIFVGRKQAILLSHEHELSFFDSRPWRA